MIWGVKRGEDELQQWQQQQRVFIRISLNISWGANVCFIYQTRDLFGCLLTCVITLLTHSLFPISNVSRIFWLCVEMCFVVHHFYGHLSLPPINAARKRNHKLHFDQYHDHRSPVIAWIHTLMHGKHIRQREICWCEWKVNHKSINFCFSIRLRYARASSYFPLFCYFIRQIQS